MDICPSWYLGQKTRKRAKRAALVKSGEIWYTPSEPFQNQEEFPMEPVYYTINTINGDYAYMTSDSGVENQVAMFLLPDGSDVGSRLRWENFEWSLVQG
jgi:hypothetical protein